MVTVHDYEIEFVRADLGIRPRRWDSTLTGEGDCAAEALIDALDGLESNNGTLDPAGEGEAYMKADAQEDGAWFCLLHYNRPDPMEDVTTCPK